MISAEKEGLIANNGAAKVWETKLCEEMKLQSLTSTSVRVLGKVDEDADWSQLSTICMADMTITDTITDKNIYTADVAGLYAVTVEADGDVFARMYNY